MREHIILLRGINVGGVTIRMAELVELLTGLGYGSVRTVLASGNAVVSTDETAEVVRRRVEAALGERFGYRARVQTLDPGRMRRVLADYPFERGRDGWHDYVTFVDDDTVLEELVAVPAAIEGEQAGRGDGVLYWTVSKGRSLESSQSLAQSAAARKMHVTTRNIRTLERLLE